MSESISQHPQVEGPLPRIRLEYVGQLPPQGVLWCATCSILYMGAISADKNNIEKCRELVERGMERKAQVVAFALPDHPWYQLREAVTTAPSVLIPYPMPVCWVHLSGRIPETPTRPAPGPNGNLIAGNLIAGKAYRTKETKD